MTTALAKLCTGCREPKAPDEFYKGHSRCKRCSNQASREWERANPEKKRRARRAWKARNPKRNAEANRKWREANPEKWAAHVAVELALRRGALVRPDHCPECGRSGVIHAHHHDYDKPLDIEWLCPTCHKARHSAEVDPCA